MPKNSWTLETIRFYPELVFHLFFYSEETRTGVFQSKAANFHNATRRRMWSDLNLMRILQETVLLLGASRHNANHTMQTSKLQHNGPVRPQISMKHLDRTCIIWRRSTISTCARQAAAEEILHQAHIWLLPNRATDG